ncbi:LacI family transcriptional regulator [Streptomyces ipomoeae]|uniref:LacI family transcriptional regulator n=1 Tax=Streptomyces ipomoeae TaxID=103232 RepID=A0A540QPA3_9ACTN|nr:LacI family DNA-binding transcriptional regulator [Streptomyces ipomoeae]MDX2878142.1 LacI family DNA-binding transcriptional regulator [Streptomyces ipomoeae]MDX2936145.1 LacI family DNA-binding transcriptional regulator [Streptomyces ipomoeae]TQE23572.1 LacI family transcriptional regulator [Streptomyces ipomoeae]TQE31215.1 LacI family transcriptional regulator [Streptomyces ipomoeae]TQE37313.1 LacI family transcriptional regulator [Streptomyces ipomoeae]
MTPVVERGTAPSVPRSADVARLAGVSRKTVSRVLNNEPYVSDEARRRVLAAAEELGYRLNHAARALASGRTRSIGVVALGTAGYGTASLLVHIEQAVRDAGYALRVVNTPDGDPEGIAGAMESLLEQGVDGVVVSEPIVEGEVRVRADVPVLFLGAPPAFDARRTLAVDVAAHSLARAATEHLLDLGHATVHHVSGPPRWYASKDRLEGWRAALAARGAHEPPVVEGDWSAESGYTAGLELAGDSSVTAVFAAGDEMAIGLIHALREAGRRVPEDVSVVGFDGNPVFAYVSPPLTTVRQPFDAAAREGIRLLMHAIEKPGTELPQPSEPPVELVVRGSTAPPPSHQNQTVRTT